MTKTTDLKGVAGLKHLRSEDRRTKLEDSPDFKTFQIIHLGMGNPYTVEQGIKSLNESMWAELERRMPYSLSVSLGFKKELSKSGYAEYFKEGQDFSLEAAPARKKETSYKGILTTVLKETEKENGFAKASYAWGVGAAAFLDNLRARRPFKDYSASVANHGEYTHRIQWWIVLNRLLVKSPNNAAYFEECAKWYCELEDQENRKVYLWDLLFDSAVNTTGESENDAHGRSPIYVFQKCRADSSSLLGAFLNYRVEKARDFNDQIINPSQKRQVIALGEGLGKIDVPAGILERAARRFRNKSFADLPQDERVELRDELLRKGFTDDKGEG